jgi:cell wall-associated NlpC family hydrolase
MIPREVALEVAWSLHGTPYIWSGDDPTGFDCSGFCIELLQSAGALPRTGDWTAHGLYLKFPAVENPHLGCLAFWKRGGRVTHVEFCLDGKYTMGASGGGPRTTDPATAAIHNAYVKVRPLKPGAVFADPFMEDNAP